MDLRGMHVSFIITLLSCCGFLALINYGLSSFLLSYQTYVESGLNLLRRHGILLLDMILAAAVLQLNTVCMRKLVHFMNTTKLTGSKSSTATCNISGTDNDHDQFTQGVCDIFGQLWIEHPIICDDDFTAPPTYLLRIYGHNF